MGSCDCCQPMFHLRQIYSRVSWFLFLSKYFHFLNVVTIPLFFTQYIISRFILAAATNSFLRLHIILCCLQCMIATVKNHWPPTFSKVTVLQYHINFIHGFCPSFYMKMGPCQHCPIHFQL